MHYLHYLQFLFTYTSFWLNAWYQSQVSSVYRWTLQQDGAPSHTANNTINYLKRENVSFNESQMWPPNSPDLNPLDDAVWGTLQQQFGPATSLARPKIYYCRSAETGHCIRMEQVITALHWPQHWRMASSYTRVVQQHGGHIEHTSSSEC